MIIIAVLTFTTCVLMPLGYAFYRAWKLVRLERFLRQSRPLAVDWDEVLQEVQNGQQ